MEQTLLYPTLYTFCTKVYFLFRNHTPYVDLVDTPKNSSFCLVERFHSLGDSNKNYEVYSNTRITQA